MAMGMQSVWLMGDYDDIARMPYPDAAGYLKYGGNAYGNATFAPSYLHQFDD
jgi:L-ascorbate oxidase